LELSDAIMQAQEHYDGDLPVTIENARHWVYDGLLPKPARRGRGRGGGIVADYPEDTPAQILTAVATMHKGYTRKETARARKVVLEGAPLDADYMQGVPDLFDVIVYPSGYEPPLPSPRARRMADAIRFYAHVLALIRAGRNVTRPLPECLHKRQWEQDGKQMFSYFVSAPGYYIDPRGKDDIIGPAADIDQQIRAQRAALAALRDRNGAS